LQTALVNMNLYYNYRFTAWVRKEHIQMMCEMKALRRIFGPSEKKR